MTPELKAFVEVFKAKIKPEKKYKYKSKKNETKKRI